MKRRALLASVLSSLSSGQAEIQLRGVAGKGDACLFSLAESALAALGLDRIHAGDTGAKIARRREMTLPDLVVLKPDVSFSRLKVGPILVIASPERPTR